MECGEQQSAAQARSVAPVAFATASTIRREAASISSSVSVRSRGCSVTSIATDFRPSPDRPAGEDVEHRDRLRPAPCRRPRAARTIRSAATSVGDHEGEVARDRLQVGEASSAGRAVRDALRQRHRVEVDLEGDEPARRRPWRRARADASRRTSPAGSSGRASAIRRGRDGTRPAPRPRPAACPSARRSRRAAASASALASKTSTARRAAVPVPRRRPCRAGCRRLKAARPRAGRRHRSGRPRRAPCRRSRAPRCARSPR